MRRGFFFAIKVPSAFQYDVDAEFFPGEPAWIFFSTNTNALTIDDHRVAVNGDGAIEMAMNRIMTRQVGIDFCIAQVIDGDQGEFFAAAAFVDSPQNIAANTTITIDCQTDRHAACSGKGRD